jgi:hypothetical protein
MQQNVAVPLSDGPRTADAHDIAELRRRFEQDGYVVLRNVVSSDALVDFERRIRAEYERVVATNELFVGGGRLAGHLNCFPGEPARPVYQELRAKGVIDVMRAIGPNVVREPNVGCNFNLPNSVMQHYHADTNYYVEEFSICNVAVVDTGIENGAIELAPGTHQRFYPFWRFAVERTARRGIRVPMNRGDVLLRRSNLWHRGMPNRTKIARPMLAFTWEDGGCNRPDPFAWEGGRIKFFQNWYRSNLLGRLRERTYVAAPITYDAYRFVRSLVGKKGYSRT